MKRLWNYLNPFSEGEPLNADHDITSQFEGEATNESNSEDNEDCTDALQFESMHPWLHSQLVKLGLKEFYPGKLKKKHLITISSFDISNDGEPRIGFLFLKKLLGLNANCRKIFENDEDDEPDESDKCIEEPCTYRTAIMLIFACSDPFLRRYLVEKMQMCQFAVPFMLPMTKELLLYPLRITRSWTSTTSGVKERCLASEPMPMLSVMQIGDFDGSVSSELLNRMFNEPGYNGFSNVMDEVPEGVCDGLVELAWYLPRGRMSDIYPDAFVAVNLHGDATNCPEQVNFLIDASDVVIIIAKSIEDVEKLLLQKAQKIFENHTRSATNSGIQVDDFATCCSGTIPSNIQEKYENLRNPQVCSNSNIKAVVGEDSSKELSCRKNSETGEYSVPANTSSESGLHIPSQLSSSPVKGKVETNTNELGDIERVDLCGDDYNESKGVSAMTRVTDAVVHNMSAKISLEPSLSVCSQVSLNSVTDKVESKAEVCSLLPDNESMDTSEDSYKESKLSSTRKEDSHAAQHNMPAKTSLEHTLSAYAQLPVTGKEDPKSEVSSNLEIVEQQLNVEENGNKESKISSIKIDNSKLHSLNDIVQATSKSISREKVVVALNTTKKEITKVKSQKHEHMIIPFVRIEDVMKSFKKVKPKLLSKSSSLEERVQKAQSFEIEEHKPNSRQGKTEAELVMAYVNRYSDFTAREKILPFQEKYKQWVRLDKEQTRRINLINRDMKQDWLEKHERRKDEIVRSLQWSTVSECFQTFLLFLKKSPTRMHYLEWLQYLLNKRSQRLEQEQQTKLEEHSKEERVLHKRKNELIKSSLGLEHFFREVALLWMLMSKRQKTDVERVKWLPEVIASLLLECCPLEIVDGDASFVPLQWIRKVFDSINHLIGKDVKVSVASILGVQSSGKSTFLNTMFGINFAVSSGRCTRGAYLQLVKVDASAKNKLGNDYLAVIDTEGLKSAEQIGYDNEHDNELGTLTVGISDLSLMNIGGENDESMKDVLQIICHAFLRMTATLNQKPNCMMVHQNVGDLAANQKTTIAKVKFFQTLDEMTQVAAKMENCEQKYKQFADVIDYDTEKMDIYVPGLWHGSPPMASVNIDYSEAAQKSKTFLLDEIKRRSLTLHDFANRLKIVDAAVKQENFIFSFQNTISAKAYQGLAQCYEEEKWKIKTELLDWLAEMQIKLKQEGDYSNKKKESVTMEGRTNVTAFQTKLENVIAEYFSDHQELVPLLEAKRSLVEDDIVATKLQMLTDLNKEVHEIFNSLKNEERVDRLIADGEKYLRPKLLELKTKHSIATETLTKDQKEMLQKDFDDLWDSMLNGLQCLIVEKQNVETEMMDCLLRHIKLYNQHLKNEPLETHSYKVKYEDLSFAQDIALESKKRPLFNFFSRKEQLCPKAQALERAQRYTNEFLNECRRFISNITEPPSMFRVDFCHTILAMVTESIQSVRDPDFQFRKTYMVDILHLVSHLAAKKLSEMQEKYMELHDPRRKLEKSKVMYFNVLCSLVETGNQVKVFCEEIVDGTLTQLYEHFQVVLREHITSNKLELCSCKQVELAICVELHKTGSFKKYMKYLTRHKSFTLAWLHDHVLADLSELMEDGSMRYVSMMATRARHVLNSLLNAVQIASRCGNYIEFLERLRKETFEKGIHINLDCHRLERLKMLPIQDFPEFIVDLEKYLQNESHVFIKGQLKEVDVTTELQKLNTPIEEQLYEALMCKEGAQCPFCSAPCTVIGPHTEHKVDMHQPQGLRGYRYEDTRKLVERICPVSVSSSRMFRNTETNNVFVPYADYRKFYPDWDIPSDPHPASTKYWKMVLMNYNKQIANSFGCEEADIPESWKSYLWPVVKADLGEVYDTGIKD